MQDTIIIGAGPTGLMAAYDLSRQGRKVLVLEARDRIGGRAFTQNGLEMGAEFIHGDLPIVQALLKEAGIAYHAATGEWVQLRAGKAGEAFEADGWPQLMKALRELKEDLSLQDFLTAHFADDKYAALKDQATSYAEGYDTADTSRVSAMALCEEWDSDEEDQYRIEGGYGALMAYLEKAIVRNGGNIRYALPVSAIDVRDEGVDIIAAGKSFSAAHAIVAMPLGVLQRSDALRITGHGFTSYKDALLSLGFGDVIKFVLRFSERFWEDQYPELGFLLSSAPVPTWWTQMPERCNVLTGWLSGRAARTHASMPEAQMLGLAIASLAQIFSRDEQAIAGMLSERHIVNWSSDPYTLGSYAYATVGYASAQETLSNPLAGRLFFAGEYMYKGPAMGTVEAAFWSGRETAGKLLKKKV